MANKGSITITGEDKYLTKIGKMLRGYRHKVEIEMSGVENPVAEAKEQRAKEEKAAAELKAQEEAERKANQGDDKDITTDKLTGTKVVQPVGKTKGKK